jgi:hypothetical protein
VVIGRPDLDRFELGAFYRNDHTDAVLEFMGIATMPELHDEVVGIFRFIDGGGCLVATHAGFDAGETFTPLGDAMADDIGLAGGP